MNAVVDGKIVQISLPASVMAALKPKAPPPPPPATNGVWTVGDRVKPIGWTSESGKPSIATVVRVTDGGVHVEFGPDVTGDCTTVPFFFVNESVEAA